MYLTIEVKNKNKNQNQTAFQIILTPPKEEDTKWLELEGIHAGMMRYSQTEGGNLY